MSRVRRLVILGYTASSVHLESEPEEKVIDQMIIDLGKYSLLLGELEGGITCWGTKVSVTTGVLIYIAADIHTFFILHRQAREICCNPELCSTDFKGLHIKIKM